MHNGSENVHNINISAKARVLLTRFACVVRVLTTARVIDVIATGLFMIAGRSENQASGVWVRTPTDVRRSYGGGAGSLWQGLRTEKNRG